MSHHRAGITVKVTLARDGASALVSFPYSPALTEALRSLSAYFQPSLKQWVLPLHKHAAFVRCSGQQQPQVSLSPLPDWVVAAAQTPRWDTHALLDAAEAQKTTAKKKGDEADAFAAGVVARLPRAAAAKLKPYQLRGVLCAVKREGRVLWGDEMGLGKTVQVRMRREKRARRLRRPCLVFFVPAPSAVSGPDDCEWTGCTYLCCAWLACAVLASFLFG